MVVPTQNARRDRNDPSIGSPQIHLAKAGGILHAHMAWVSAGDVYPLTKSSHH